MLQCESVGGNNWSAPPIHDIFVIGGGINGCGIARDAVGRGFSVFLAEMNDLASGTSSGSTKLIHGGLRYLEHYEFRLVREALMEREVLWRNAPHIIWPMRFVLPYHKGGPRPAWLIRLGLFLYDHIGGRKLLPATTTLDMRSDPAGKPLKPLFTKAFEYSDGWVNDARLVVLNARDAADRGAIDPHPHQGDRARAAKTATGRSTIEDMRDRERAKRSRRGCSSTPPAPGSIMCCRTRSARTTCTMSAWCRAAISSCRKKFDDPRAYFFQNKDGRIIFAIPYEDDFTLIGTTDQDYAGDPHDAQDQRRRDRTISAMPRANISPSRSSRDDIVWTYSGVRPLYDDGASKAQEATRDYVLKADAATARRRSSTSSAARSPPIAGSPNRCWRRSKRFLGKQGQAVDGDRAAAGRRFRGDRLRRRGRAS